MADAAGSSRLQIRRRKILFVIESATTTVVSLPSSQHYRVPGRSRGATATLEKGGVTDVQYATMIDLLREAEIAGEARTEFVNERLADAFDIWLSEQDPGEITEEEEHELRMAFERGFGICFHHAQ
jgi:hypothetical protein